MRRYIFTQWGNKARFAFNIIIALSMLLSQTGLQLLPAQAAAENEESPSAAVKRPIFIAPVIERPLSRIVKSREAQGIFTIDNKSTPLIDTPTVIPTPMITPTPQITPTPSSLPLNDSTSSQIFLSQGNTAQAMNADASEWILNGYADDTTIPGAIKLTDNDFMEAGSAWNIRQVDLSDNFDMTFTIYLGEADNGADGVAFVLQNTGTDALGDVGRGLGYWHISPSIEIEIDTYYNAEQNDPYVYMNGNNTQDHIALMLNGNINHDNETLPMVMPDNTFEDGTLYNFHFHWDATSKTLSVTNLEALIGFSYTEDIVQTIFGGDSTVWFGITGATGASTNLHYFIPHINYANTINDLSTLSSDPGLDISCMAVCTQDYEGGPINTRTGGYDYSTKDISFQSDAGEISFERTYSSLAVNQYSAKLGYGWTHNHDVYLSIGEYDPNTNIRNLILKSKSANQYIFHQEYGSSSAIASPGVYATLVEGSSSFLLTDRSQNLYEFDLTTGRMISKTNPTGQKIFYTFDAGGRLTKISDQSGQHYLDLDYSGESTLIQSIVDHSNRVVSYGYDVNNDLVSVTDTLEQTWSYTYDTSHHLLSVLDPNHAIIERTEYDTSGRAYRQYDGADRLVVELTFNADGTTTIKDAFNNLETRTFDSRKTLTSQTDSASSTFSTTYDYNFRPATITDASDNTTNLTWSTDGADLIFISDALNGEVSIVYDANHNPTSIIDPQLQETKYFYQDPSFPTLLTRVEYPLSFDGGISYTGTDYVYYQPGDLGEQPAGKLKLVTDALGNQILYTYIASGQIASVTVGYGSAASQSTSYLYDDVGNMTDQTAQGITTHFVYDAAGRMISEIRNYDELHGTNEGNLYNLTTEYTFDVRGNQIAIETPDGLITRTYFDLSDRLTTRVENLVGQSIEVTTPPERGNIPDQNLRTDYYYDAEGTQIATQDPAGIIERTFYDETGRPETIVQNLYGQGPEINTVPLYYPAYPDRNVRTDYVYDVNSNNIASIDNAGIITRTYYNELNLPVYVVQNLTGQAITVTTPPSRGTGDENLVTEIRYDTNGNTIATIDPSGTITRNYYDALNRPITIVRNLTSDHEYETWPPDRTDPGEPDSDNIRIDTYYDQVGNAIATIDSKWVITRTFYDEANRPIAVVRNLEGQDIYDPNIPVYSDGDTNVMTRASYDAYGRKETSTDEIGRVTKYGYNALGQIESITENYLDGESQNYLDKFNLITTYKYDVGGRLFETTDTMGRVTRNNYDEIGRLTATTRNFLPDQIENFLYQYNLISSSTYDQLGNRLSTTDANGHTTWTAYDGLNRPVTVADPNEHITTTVYNASGNVNSVTDALSHTTTYVYDDLGRQTAVTDAGGHVNGNVYDATGNRVQFIDGNGVVTLYEYDRLERLSAVVENYLPTVIPTVEINVRTEYTYDANDNLMYILDGNGNTTHFGYDPLNHLIFEIDAEDHKWEYGYYGNGDLLAMLDPNGVSTYYWHDEAGRLVTIDYQFTGEYATFIYDAAGRRTSMTDDQGTTTWTYDMVDRIKTVTDPFDQTVTYDYDPAGNKTGLTYPDLSTVTYEFGPANELKTVTSAEFGNVSYGYNSVGQLQTVTRPNGIHTAYDYLDNGWLEKITHSSSTETLASYQYQYNAAGNRTQAQEFLAGDSETSVPTVVVTVMESSGTPLAGKPVYAFDGSNYSGYSKVTDANGQVAITLPEGDYHFRADVEGTQFWSDTVDHCTVGECGSVLITVPEPVLVTVQDTGGVARSGLAVYAFNGTTYSGYHGTTDTAGQLSLRLPVGSYRFRVDFNGTQFWSGSTNHCDVPGCSMASVVVTLPVTVTVQDTSGNPKAGLNVYAFNGSVFTGYSKATDLNGQAVFTLPQGNYRFRADLNYTQFWSGPDNHCTLPGCTSTGVVVTVPLTVTVRDSNGDPAFSLRVYAFNGSIYTGYNKTTDANGQATFTLPAGSYRFRADLNGTQFWSGTENHCTLPGCESAALTVTRPVTVTVQDTNGIPLSAISVYAFNGTTYTGYSKTTNTSGQAVFTLPLGSYRFRADVRGTQYWSGTENHCGLPVCESAVVVSGILATPTPGAMLRGKVTASIKPSDSAQSGSTPVVLTVLDTSGDPVAGLNAYAFNGTTYTGISGTTDATGQVTFTLPAGSYRFRADRNGTQFWSGSENHCTTPGCETAGITVTIPLTVTVSDTGSQPSTGLKVYAFNGSTYTGYSKTTDVNGQAVFTLPLGSYHFRSDLNGTQFWSDETDHCTLPGCTEVAVTVTIPLTLTVANQAGTPFEGLHVYAFNGTTYTGYNKVTDASGQAVFTLPAGNYRFRADYDGVPFWSGAINHCDLPGCTAVSVTIPGGAGSLVIDYDYDPLGRLTSADYSDDTSYTYTYDSVGNRMTQVVNEITTTTYGYDSANRMTSVNGVTITWDNNGNLLNDGVNTYTYNGENRLIAYSNGTDTYEYTYNGLGDRLSQTVDGVVTNYTLDLNAGLTQILDDGTNSYLYGMSRIAESQGGANEYYLGDVLGSVRQLTNGYGELTLSKGYDPFGNNLLSIGTGITAYGYTGESTDANGLIYLRARYYNPEQGRFITRDTWEGGVYSPNSLNRFAYANNDPIKNSDPSGYCVFAGVDTYICGIIAGGFIGAFTGAAFGGSYAAWMYHLALTGKCGCEGDLLIRKYTKTQFILSAVEQGAAFGAVFGALSAAGYGGVAFAAIAGVGFSTVGLINSVQRIQVDPNNECAWWDLGMSILGLTSSLSTLATARVFYNKAVQNPGSTKGSLIGDWKKDSPLSYENIAKKYGFKHLDLKGIYYEMFKGIFGEKLWGQLINEPYIRGIAREGKPVYLSTNPKDIRASSNVQFEYNLLIKLGYGEAVPEPTTGLWIMNKP